MPDNDYIQRAINELEHAREETASLALPSAQAYALIAIAQELREANRLAREHGRQQQRFQKKKR